MNLIGFRIANTIRTSNKFNKPVLTLWRNCHKNPFLYPSISLFHSPKKIKLKTYNLSAIRIQRNCSSDSGGDDKKSKPTALMKFDPVLKPEILLTIKNWILTKLIIQPYLDNDFTIKDFTGGAKQALALVSSSLSQGDFQSMKGLVSDEAITEIKSNFAALNVKERQDLLIKITDILFAFPYQIGIIFDDTNQKRFAEVTVVYHSMNDFEELRTQGKVLTENAREDLKICNYRFIREYTKGVQSDWVINRLGHFKVCHFEQ